LCAGAQAQADALASKVDKAERETRSAHLLLSRHTLLLGLPPLPASTR